MKKMHIVLMLAIITGVAIIIYGSKDVSTYASFADATQNTGSVKISGQLDLEHDVVYDIEKDANSFSFYMKDGDNVSKKVILNKPKPQDFERAESVVVTGKMQEDTFMASEILMKCPSKYKDEEIRIRAEI